jgi:hypothetical protein
MSALAVLAHLPVYCTHQEWESNNPLDREYAQSVTHGLEQRGLPADREFPCPGLLHDLEPGADLVVVCCDVCTFETSFRRQRDIDPNRTTESATKRDEDIPF